MLMASEMPQQTLRSEFSDHDGSSISHQILDFEVFSTFGHFPLHPESMLSKDKVEPLTFDNRPRPIAGLTRSSTSGQLSCADTTPPPGPSPGCSYTPVAALSAVSSASQGCVSQLQIALSHRIPDTPVGCRGWFRPLKPCRADGHFDTKEVDGTSKKED